MPEVKRLNISIGPIATDAFPQDPGRQALNVQQLSRHLPSFTRNDTRAKGGGAVSNTVEAFMHEAGLGMFTSAVVAEVFN